MPPAPRGSSDEDRAAWPVWIGRIGAPEPQADDASLTPSERVELCWEVTKQAWALTGAVLDESACVEILRAFRDEGVEHLVIGAHALAVHGPVRAG